MRSRSVTIAVTAGVALVLACVGARPASALNDSLYKDQWGLQVIGAQTAWNAGFMGQGVDIAIVDTGVHLTHQDLVPNLVPGRNFITPNAAPQDDECSNGSDGASCGHGTHVAGIAAAAIDNGGSVGVAPRAHIMPVKVLGSDGSGSTQTIADGIRWAVANGAEVINLSLGSDLQGVTGASQPLIAAARDAWAKGVICVFAAGNDFVLGSGIADEPVIVVSATNKSDGKPDFSSGVGNARWGIAAPGGGDTLQFSDGEDILSTVWYPGSGNDKYSPKRGTSMAAPFVSGAAALLRAAGLSPQQTVDRLLATAKDVGAAGKDSTFGAGRLDVAKAVQGLSPGPGVTAPPAPTTTARAAATGSGTTPTTVNRSTATTARRANSSSPAPATASTPSSGAPASTAPGQDATQAVLDPESSNSSAHSGGAGSLAAGKSGDKNIGDGLPLLAVLAAGALIVAIGSAIPLLAVPRLRRRGVGSPRHDD